MYLSRIPLDIGNRNTMRALASPSIIHGAIENSFPGDRKRNLWRIDNIGNKLFILLLSEMRPEPASFCSQFGLKNEGWETKVYDDFVAGIRTGEKLRFRITANPTKSLLRKDGRRGKRVAVTVEHRKNWLMEKGKKSGFALTEDSFNVIQSKWYQFYKQGNRTVSFLSVTYEGILEVTNAEAFRNVLIYGLGSGKAYGMGMLTVMRISEVQDA